VLATCPARASAQSLVPLRIATPGGDTYAEPFYALDMGFLAKAGFDGEVTVLNNAGAALAAVVGGSVDVAIGDIIGITNAVAHGIPIEIFAGAGLYTSNAATTFLCVDRNAAIRGAKDLEGQTVAVVTLVGLGTSATKAWLTQNGADLAKIRFIELPQSEMQPALARGTIAGAVLVEPFFTAAKNVIRVLGKPYDAIAREFLICQWIATHDWLTQHAADAHRLVAAIYDTARWANANHDASLPIIAKYNKVDPERMRGIVRAAYATRLDVGLIQPVIDVGVRYKTIERPFDAATIIVKP
jgi:NitT/TauT family transport system substrate-binding protein